jgi:hypothetical protein
VTGSGASVSDGTKKAILSSVEQLRNLLVHGARSDCEAVDVSPVFKLLRLLGAPPSEIDLALETCRKTPAGVERVLYRGLEEVRPVGVVGRHDLCLRA